MSKSTYVLPQRYQIQLAFATSQQHNIVAALRMHAAKENKINLCGNIDTTV
jgi:hypothetical protein